MENSIKNSTHIAKSAVITGFTTNKTADKKLKTSFGRVITAVAVSSADSRQCHTSAGLPALAFHRSR